MGAAWPGRKSAGQARPVFIYVLCDPSDLKVRYVGKSETPERRLKAHVRDASRGRHATARWITQLLALGTTPIMRVIGEVPCGEDWGEAEKRAIAEHIAAGCDLTNSTSGGQGLRLLRPEDRAACSRSMSAAWARPGARERRCASLKAASARPETVARRIKAANDPEIKARRLAGLVAFAADADSIDELRRRQVAAANRPDVKAAKAKASLERWKNPAFRAAMSEKHKAAWKRRNSLKE